MLLGATKSALVGWMSHNDKRGEVGRRMSLAVTDRT